MKGRTIHNNLHMVRLIVEQGDSETALIHFDHFKEYDRVDHKFLGTVIESVGFGPYFRS